MFGTVSFARFMFVLAHEACHENGLVDGVNADMYALAQMSSISACLGWGYAVG